MRGTVLRNRFKCNNAVMDLPDDLELPLASGAAWWYWLGGRPALDFVNTLRERWWRNVETLVTPDDLAQWLLQAELVERTPRVPRALLAPARDLREAINDCVVAVAEERPPPRRALRAIDGWLGAADVPDRLVAGADGLPQLVAGDPRDPAAHALGLIARDAAAMLGTGERERLRICASGSCSARFYDRSRAGARRWCSMQGCGNVAKARRHRERATAER